MWGEGEKERRDGVRRRQHECKAERSGGREEGTKRAEEGGKVDWGVKDRNGGRACSMARG